MPSIISLIILEITIRSINAVEERTPLEIAAIKRYEEARRANENLIDAQKGKINGIDDPFERKETQLYPSKTLVKYADFPLDIIILIIIFAPVIVAAILRYIMVKYFELQCPKKAHKDDPRRGIFFEPSPQLPLHYLQQTSLEGQVKRESRQTLSWYSKTWVLKTNELIDEVGGFSLYSNKHDPDQKIYLLKENRWKIIQTVVRVGGLYRQFMKSRNKDQVPTDVNSRIRRKSVLLKSSRNTISGKSNE